MPLAREPFSLDQIRTFLIVAEAGSFSAAARTLGRAQSAISFVVAGLEQALGVTLFVRGPRGLTLTEAGRVLLPRAREIVQATGAFRRLAGDLAAGNETEVVLAVDVLFPLARVTRAITAFAETYPAVATRLHVEPLGGVAQLVIDRRCALGIIGSLPDIPEDLVGERLGSADIVAVAAPGHPLAALDSWPDEALRPHRQLVVTDRTTLSAGRDFAVFADRTLRTSDLAAKHAMLLEGIGWGAMPLHLVAHDLAAGRLIRLDPDAWHGAPLRLPFQLIRHASSALGPAATHLGELLRRSPAAVGPAAGP